MMVVVTPQLAQQPFNTAPCGVCRAPPGTPHERGCPYPGLVVELRPDLWSVERRLATAVADVALEACNRRAMVAWLRSGRSL